MSNEVTREDVLDLAVRADRCGRKTLATNLYLVAELMSNSGDKFDQSISDLWKGMISEAESNGSRQIANIADDGASRSRRLGIGVAAGMVS